MRENPYAFFQGEAPELSYSRNNSAPSLLPELYPGNVAAGPSRERFNLGGNLTFDTPTFSGFSSGNAPSFQQSEPKLREPVGVVGGTAKALLKSEFTRDAFPLQQEKWSSSVGYAGLVYSSAKTGKTISDTITANQEAGQSDTEAYVCGVLKVMSKEVPEKVVKGLIVGGVPAYLVASVGSPPLAATLPVVLPLIPMAYKGAEVMAQKLSSYADDVCHAQFTP